MIKTLIVRYAIRNLLRCMQGLTTDSQPQPEESSFTI